MIMISYSDIRHHFFGLYVHFIVTWGESAVDIKYKAGTDVMNSLCPRSGCALEGPDVHNPADPVKGKRL